MELKTMILGHFLVISLALNAGLLYRDYCNNGKHKSVELFSFKPECKNESLVTKRDARVAEMSPFESSSSKVVDGVVDLDQTLSKESFQAWTLLYKKRFMRTNLKRTEKKNSESVRRA